jgi:hypothetical protein
MKKFTITILFLALTTALFSQTTVPQLVNFQAVARNADNSLIANSTVELKLTIRQGSATGTALYCSVYASVPTNQNGSFSIQLNRGTFASACNSAPGITFDQIDWSTGSKWVQIEYRPNTGPTFTDLGAIELASVPYAFAARTSERVKTIPYATASSSSWINSTQTRNWVSPPNMQVTVPESGIYMLSATASAYGTHSVTARVYKVASNIDIPQAGFLVGSGNGGSGTNGDASSGSVTTIVTLTKGEVLRLDFYNELATGAWFYGLGTQLNIVKLGD